MTPGIRIEKVKGSDLEESFTELLHFRREKSRVLQENKEELRQSAEKATAAHSRTLAWKIPWTEEPGGLQSVGWLEVRYNWATSLSLFTFMHWRRKWQPTPVFLPGESQELVGCRLWGRTESDTTEATSQRQRQQGNLRTQSQHVETSTRGLDQWKVWSPRFKRG